MLSSEIKRKWSETAKTFKSIKNSNQVWITSSGYLGEGDYTEYSRDNLLIRIFCYEVFSQKELAVISFDDWNDIRWQTKENLETWI